MTILKLIFSFFYHSPDLLKLFLLVEKNIQESNTERKTGQDIKAIKNAFKNKDASILRDVFNNELRDKAD